VTARVAVLVLVGALATACGGLQLSRDTRVAIQAPASMSTVSTPVHLRWTDDGATTAGRMFAVFVDSLPVHPGQNLRSLAGPTCAAVAGCVDRAWLERHFVFLTQRPSLDIGALPILGTPRGDPDVHTATIVLVDPGWQRVGESAWSVSFSLQRT